MLLDDAVNDMPMVKTRYDLKPCLHNTTCCQTGCQTALTNGCIVYTAGCLRWSAVVCGFQTYRWSKIAKLINTVVQFHVMPTLIGLDIVDIHSKIFNMQFVNHMMMWQYLLQACVRLMPATMLYSGRSADETHLIVSTVFAFEMIIMVPLMWSLSLYVVVIVVIVANEWRCARIRLCNSLLECPVRAPGP